MAYLKHKYIWTAGIASLIAVATVFYFEKSKNPKIAQLGVIELTENQPSHHNIGNGNTATITAKTLASGLVELKVVLEGRDVNGRKLVLSPPPLKPRPLGKPVTIFTDKLGTYRKPQATRGQTSPRTINGSNKQWAESSADDMGLRFTPKMKENPKP